MRHRTSRLALSGCMLGVALLCAHPASAQVTVFNQPTDLNGGFASQNDTNSFGNFATVYDNFSLGSNTSIGSVTWVGSYYNPPAQGTITGFTLTIWDDNSGQPGSALQTTTVSGTANETSLGNDNFGDPAFSYSANLSSAFNATAGTTYWLSIVPDVGFPPQWAWETGTGGDGQAVQDFFGARSSLASDVAFSLVSSSGAVPEPGSVALFVAMGVSGAGMLARKRRK